MNASLILVQGAPGSGKTTLATTLARELQFPMISKDALKEALADTMQIATVEQSTLLGKASIAAMFAACETYLRNGESCVLESAFVTDYANGDIEQLLKTTDTRAIQVYCVMDEQERRRRFIARQKSGQRHPVHMDDKREVSADDLTKYRPLDFKPIVEVNTATAVQGDLVYQIEALLS